MHETEFRRARELLAGGWSEPLSLDTQGKICSLNSEGIQRFCVNDALEHAASTIADPTWMEQRLMVLLGFGEWGYVRWHAWLEAPERTLADVLALFDRAILRAKHSARAA